MGKKALKNHGLLFWLSYTFLLLYKRIGKYWPLERLKIMLFELGLQHTHKVTNKPNLSFWLHCPSQVWLVWPTWSTSSASSSWPPRTSSLWHTVACEVPSPSPLVSCWTRITLPWETCSSLPSSLLSSSLSLFRYEYPVLSCPGLVWTDFRRRKLAVQPGLLYCILLGFLLWDVIITLINVQLQLLLS